MKRLEFIVNGFEYFEARVPGPALVHLLQLVVTDVEDLQLRGLEADQLGEFVVADVQPLKVLEILLVGKDCDVLDLVLRDVELDQVGELSDDCYINDVVILEVQELHVLRLQNRVVERLDALVREHEVQVLQGLPIGGEVQVLEVLLDNLGLEH